MKILNISSLLAFIALLYSHYTNYKTKSRIENLTKENKKLNIQLLKYKLKLTSLTHPQRLSRLCTTHTNFVPAKVSDFIKNG